MMKPRLEWCCLLAWSSGWAVWAEPASAQRSTGQLLVTAVSENGSPLPGAAIDLVRAGQVVQRVQADSAGLVRFAAIPAGTYDLIARMVGYRTGELNDVQLTAGESRSINLGLTFAPVELRALDVVVSTPIRISRVDTDFGKKLEQQAIRALPVSHEARDLVAFTPGARAEQVWGGATAQANNYQLDGVAANHPGLGGDMIQPSINWIESVEVLGLGAGAEHGNFQGGLINVITKSGTNSLQGALRVSGESHKLNASALEPTDIGSEISTRYDLEGEVRGPIVRDRLFYFLAGQWLERDARFINHVPGDEARYTPTLEQRAEGKFFGKLTWRPFASHALEGSVARIETKTDHYGLTGYETQDATLRLRAPSASYNLSWTSRFGARVGLEAKFAHFTRDERRDPYGGEERPGVLTYGLNPPYLGFHNAPLRYRHAPESTGGSLTWSLTPRIAGLEHLVRVGIEHNVGSFTDQRLRNGGMTWRPSRLRTMDPNDASTWFFSAAPFVAADFGGEVDLHAEVENSAVFAQGTFALHPRLSISPGIRYGRWAGRLLPGGRRQDRFTAVEDQAPEARVGLIFDITGDNTFVAKAHWGRYHQNMIAQIFERAEGGNVFSDEETWYYRGPVFSDPATSFTRAQRDELAPSRQFTLEQVIQLNETGPTENYKQPYVDQWIIGLEKTISDVVKMQAVYVNRRNRRMVALVDRNRETNYTAYDNVRVVGLSGEYLPFEGGTVQLRRVYLPNNVLRERLECRADGSCPDNPLPPRLTVTDIPNLTWNPDYVLTNAPDARRKFDQVQLSLQVARPSWSASASWVFTNLEGNLDSVTGYDDPAGFGAGPYVRVNEGVNSYGKLPNYADQEMKVTFFGDLPWKLRGGAFWTHIGGDHFAPYFTISGSGTYRYQTNDRTQFIDAAFFYPLAGHRVFVGPRGLQRYFGRSQLDFRLERELFFRNRGWTVTMDVFNVTNTAIVTEVNRSVNRGQNYYGFLGPQYEGFRVIDPREFYLAVMQRMPPRTLRLGTALYF